METLTNSEVFLAYTEVVDWQHPAVSSLALQLAADEKEPATIARRCFEWVRDEIQHCMDYGRLEVTCKASDVLTIGTGFCYAKSHLLAALLRANRIPAGFAYQRLSYDGIGPPFCLHGLNAIWLPQHGWFRADARGNKEGVAAEFTPPAERIAFPIQFDGEFDLPGVYSDPLPAVVSALQGYDRADVLVSNLPDVTESFTEEL